MRHRSTLALLTGVAALIAWAPAARAEAPPQPGLGVRLLDAPTNRAHDPRARVYVVDQVRPGAAFTRHVEVSNGDDAPMDVLVYPAAATIHDGGFDIAARGAPGAVPSWASVSPSRLHLEPGARVPVTVDFRVPSNAASGEVYGAIVAERPPSRSGGSVRVGVRAGIRVYLSVGEGAEPASDFTVDALTAERDATGRPVVLASVHNTGGRALDLSGELKLSDGPGSLSAGPFPARLGTTLGVGQTGQVTVPLDRALPAGPWLATLELRSGELRRRVEGRISFPSTPSTKSPPVHPRELPLYEKRTVVVPVAVVAVGVVSLALLWLALLAWRRRRRDEDEQEAK
jgi:hypothetical protein